MWKRHTGVYRRAVYSLTKVLRLKLYIDKYRNTGCMERSSHTGMCTAHRSLYRCIRAREDLKKKIENIYLFSIIKFQFGSCPWVWMTCLNKQLIERLRRETSVLAATAPAPATQFQNTKRGIQACIITGSPMLSTLLHEQSLPIGVLGVQNISEARVLLSRVFKNNPHSTKYNYN